MNNVLEASVFAMLVLELIKQITFKWFPNVVLTEKVYAVLLPILSYLSVPFLAVIGYTNYSLPVSLESFAQELVRVVISSLVAVVLYNNTLKTNSTADTKPVG